jgi:hypothetical protein
MGQVPERQATLFEQLKWYGIFPLLHRDHPDRRFCSLELTVRGQQPFTPSRGVHQAVQRASNLLKPTPTPLPTGNSCAIQRSWFAQPSKRKAKGRSGSNRRQSTGLAHEAPNSTIGHPGTHVRWVACNQKEGHSAALSPGMLFPGDHHHRVQPFLSS